MTKPTSDKKPELPRILQIIAPETYFSVPTQVKVWIPEEDNR